MVVVRENSEGLYSGAGGFHRKGTEHEVAVQESINTRHGVERIVRYAFELAMRPDRRRKLTLVHKTNVLTFAGDLYQRVVNEVAAEFPDVETDYVHVDACCIYFLDQPARFDVIVTDNMFGDIITDLGAMIQGGMGIAAGGNINPAGVSMFEPIGGTAPDHVGKATINPLAAIGAVQMLLAQLGEDGAACARLGGHPVRVHEDGVDAGRRDGLCDTGGRRSRGGTGDGMTTAPTPGVRRKVELYDTTLRDGAQQTGLSYSIEDRLRILHKIDQLGVPFIEGGWPGANPRDTEFFRLATKETLQHAALTSFGMTRKAGEGAEESAVLRELLDTGTEVVCIVGKASDVHVTEVLRTDLQEGVAMVRDSVAFLRAQDRRVFFDAEHFFDGYLSDATYAMDVLRAAQEAGADRLVLCDTNGGMLPADIASIVAHVVADMGQTPVGIHVHNDAGCAVANSLIAVENGAFQVQGVVNGYGERTGNADLIPIAANLVLKMDADCLPDGAEERLTEVAHFVAEVANLAPDSRQPYAGRYAFTHKAGLHASGVARLEEAYEHVRPTSVGNRRGIVASDLGGAATLRMKAEEFGVELPEHAVGRLVTELKDRESRGYTFEVADASLELLMRRAGGWEQAFFTIESFRVHIEQRMEDEEDALAEATVKVVTNGTRHIESAEGHGPVGALDNALRKALTNEYPALDDMNLEDYRVRVLDETVGTGATVRVLIDTSNGEREWTTVGVSENIIEASWEALVDAYLYGLLHPREDRQA